LPATAGRSCGMAHPNVTTHLSEGPVRAAQGSLFRRRGPAQNRLCRSDVGSLESADPLRPDA
jgi:hypothetical protein